jgi:metal-responsive CopG/Arc/MetJ family transcriptional regulator
VGSHKLTITVETDLLRRIDCWVAQGRYRSRSRLIQAAIREKVGRFRSRRLAVEAAKLDPMAERAMAEEGLYGEGLERADFD